MVRPSRRREAQAPTLPCPHPSHHSATTASRSSSPLAPQPTERTGSRCLRDKPLRAPTGLVGRRCRLTAPEGRSGAASLGLGGRSSRIYGPLAKIDRLALPAARDHLNLAGANHLTTIGPHFDTMAKRAAQGWLAIHCRKARAPQRRLSPGGVRSQLAVGVSIPSHGFIKCAGRASDAELSRLK